MIPLHASRSLHIRAELEVHLRHNPTFDASAANVGEFD